MSDQGVGSEAAKAIGDPFGALAELLAGFVPEGPAQRAVLVVAGLCAALAPFIYRYYVGVLTQGSKPEDSLERHDYDKLRASLKGGNLAARLYAKWLTAFLDAVERFFGDAGMADRTLFPRAFGLKKPAPLWTAPAFDRCLFLALLYPVATIFIIWTVSGHVGPAEAALQLRPDVPGWSRSLGVAACFGFASFAIRRGLRAPGWKSLALIYVAWFVALVVSVAVFVFVAFVVSVTVPGAVRDTDVVAYAQTYFLPFAAGVTYASAIASAIASASAGAIAVAGAGVGAVAFPVAFAVEGLVLDSVGSAGAGVIAAVVAVAGVAAGVVVAVAVAVAVAVVVVAVPGAFAAALAQLSIRASKHRWQGVFLALFLIAMIVACLGAAHLLSSQQSWKGSSSGPGLLFLGLLTLLNAPFDWFSLGLTRALLRRGLELGGWWPYLLALVDAALAAVIIALLALTMVIGVQAFDELAVHGGGKEAAVLPLDALFDGIAKNPEAPEYWWAYALLLSTMIPSLGRVVN